MGRTHLDQLDLPPADIELESTVKRSRRWLNLDAVELEITEEAPEQFPNFTRCFVEGSEHRGRHLGHLIAVALEATISTSAQRLLTSLLP
jgi:hypothetical protein